MISLAAAIMLSLGSTVPDRQGVWFSRESLRVAAEKNSKVTLPASIREVILPIELFYGPSAVRAEHYYESEILPSLVRQARESGVSVTLIVSPFHFGPTFTPQQNELERTALTAFPKKSNSEYLHPFLSKRRIEFLKKRLNDTFGNGPYRVVLDIRYPNTPPHAHSVQSRQDAVRELGTDPVDLHSLGTPDYPDQLSRLDPRTQSKIFEFNAYRKQLILELSTSIARDLNLETEFLLCFGREYGDPRSLGNGFAIATVQEQFPKATLLVGVSDQTDLDGLLKIPTVPGLRVIPLVSTDYLVPFSSMRSKQTGPTKWETSWFEILNANET